VLEWVRGLVKEGLSSISRSQVDYSIEVRRDLLLVVMIETIFYFFPDLLRDMIYAIIF
jgi:hypothetical protein